MCSILNNGVSKKCTCQLAHLCKRRRKIEAEESLQLDLRKLLIKTKVPLSLTFNYALTSNLHSQSVNRQSSNVNLLNRTSDI